METLIKRCEEAIRKEVLKDFKNKIVSTDVKGIIYENPTGPYRVIDVDVSIYENEIFFDGGGMYYTNTTITVKTESLKNNKIAYFKYNLPEGC